MAEIIKKLDISHFRGIVGLELSDLSRVNVIAGINNSGKTSILEAIQIVQYPFGYGSLIRYSMDRHNEPKNFKNIVRMVATLYSQDISTYSDHPVIEIDFQLGSDHYIYESTIEKAQSFEFSEAEQNISALLKRRYALQDELRIVIKCKASTMSRPYYETFEFTENEMMNKPLEFGPRIFNCEYFGASVSQYSRYVDIISKAILNNRKNDFLEALQSFDSSIIDISIFEDDIYIHSTQRPVMPLFSMGTGVQRALLLIGLVYKASYGILLIDEIDTGLHLSMLPTIFSSILKLSRKLNVQLFITTHSIECIDSIINCAHETRCADDLRIITIRKGFSKTSCRILDGYSALVSREDYHIELRQ